MDEKLPVPPERLFLNEMGPQKANWVVGKVSQSDCVFNAPVFYFYFFMFF